MYGKVLDTFGSPRYAIFRYTIGLKLWRFFKQLITLGLQGDNTFLKFKMALVRSLNKFIKSVTSNLIPLCQNPAEQGHLYNRRVHWLFRHMNRSSSWALKCVSRPLCFAVVSFLTKQFQNRAVDGVGQLNIRVLHVLHMLTTFKVILWGGTVLITYLRRRSICRLGKVTNHILFNEEHR